METMTVAFPPVNHAETSTGARFALSHASPCCTEPLSMSLLRFGVIHTESGELVLFRVAISPALPG